MADLPRELGQLDFGKQLAENLAAIGRSVGQAQRQSEVDNIVKGIFKQIDIADPATMTSPTMYDALGRLQMNHEGRTAIGNIEGMFKMAQNAAAESRARRDQAIQEETLKLNQNQDKRAQTKADEESQTAIIPNTRRVVTGPDGSQQEIYDYGYWITSKNDFRRDKNGNPVIASAKEINTGASTIRKGSGGAGDKAIGDVGIKVRIPTIIPPNVAGGKFSKVIWSDASDKKSMKFASGSLQAAKIKIEDLLTQYIQDKRWGINLKAEDEHDKAGMDANDESIQTIASVLGDEEAQYVKELIDSRNEVVSYERTVNALGGGVGDAKEKITEPKSPTDKFIVGKKYKDPNSGVVKTYKGNGQWE